MTLEAHYPLTEDVGNVALDYSGNGFNGTLNGGAGPSGTGTVTGPFGNSAYDFDGTDDYILFGNILRTTGGFTVSGWINIDGVSTNYSIGTQWDNTDKRGWIFRVQDDGSGNGTLHFQQNSDAAVNESVKGGTLQANQWYHCVGVRDESLLRVYLNGVEVNTASHSGGEISPDGNEPFAIGRRGNQSDGVKSDGSQSDTRVYDRTLSPQEVQALYQAGERSEAVFGVTDSTAAAQSVSGGGGGGSTGGGGGGTNY